MKDDQDDQTQVINNFKIQMGKMNEKWQNKAKGEIRSIFNKGELLTQAVLIQLEEAQKRIEQQNSDLVNHLKFRMKILPKKTDPELDKKLDEFHSEVDRIEKELIENEVGLYQKIIPTDNIEDQYFQKFTNKYELMNDELDKLNKEFATQLQDMLENVFNRENISTRGGGGDKKSDEDRRAEQ